MAHAAVLAAAALTGPTQVPIAGLFVAGVDVLKQPGMAGNGYGVDPETIVIDERGPGGVSSLTFTIEDPQGVLLRPTDGDDVRLQNHVTGEPMFLGWVARSTVSPMVGGQGRLISVVCDGVEIVLDWARLTAPLLVAGSTGLIRLQDAIAAVAAAALGTGPLRTYSDDVGPGSKSSQAEPVSSFTGYHALGRATIQYDVTIPAGTTLRAALALVATAALNAGYGAEPTAVTALFTVDFTYGLRAMEDSASSVWALDYVGLTLSTAGPLVAANLADAADATPIVRGVFVQGLNAAGTGLATDDTGKMGRIEYINDPTIDTAQKLADRQTDYLASRIARATGSFNLEDWTPVAGVRPGSLLTITDAALGMAGAIRRAFALRRQLHGTGRQDVTVTYGQLPPALTSLIRQLTP